MSHTAFSPPTDVKTGSVYSAFASAYSFNETDASLAINYPQPTTTFK